MMEHAVKKDKIKKVTEVKDKIDRCKVMVLTDYTKLKVKEVTELRRQLRGHEAELTVVKNTLSARAAVNAGFEQFGDLLKGQVSLLFGYNDPIAPLKVLVTFLKGIEKGEIKGGLVEKNFVDPKEIEKLSKLPGREELIAKMVGGFKSPLYGLVNVLQGTIRKLVCTLDAVKDKKNSEGGESK